MLSDRQKSVLFKTRIVSKPRYVRVPLQMYNGVRELKTDVYFPRLLQQYQQNIELMQRLLPDERICHLRADVHGIKDWQRTYERFTCAFRSLNASRIIRRMHITGFRIVDIVGAEKPYVMRSDTFVYGVDSACVVLDSLLRSCYLIHQAHSAWLHLIYRSARDRCIFKNRWSCVSRNDTRRQLVPEADFTNNPLIPERVCFRTGNSGGFLQKLPDFPDCVSSRATIWLIGSELFPDCVSGLRVVPCGDS